MDKKTISRAIGECHEMISEGLSARNNNMISTGAFGLEIIGIMLSEPVEMPDIHVIKIDVEELNSTKPSELKTRESQPYICPRCKNEEFTPGAKFCKICGMPVIVNLNQA